MCSKYENDFGHINEEWSQMKERLLAVNDQTIVNFKEFKIQVIWDANGNVLLNKEQKEVKKLLFRKPYNRYQMGASIFALEQKTSDCSFWNHQDC